MLSVFESCSRDECAVAGVAWDFAVSGELNVTAPQVVFREGTRCDAAAPAPLVAPLCSYPQGHALPHSWGALVGK
ncbi:MAG: hypothetical protein NVS3B16_24730 [Vulcanimicrobiaceae bacterium]